MNILEPNSKLLAVNSNWNFDIFFLFLTDITSLTVKRNNKKIDLIGVHQCDLHTLLGSVTWTWYFSANFASIQHNFPLHLWTKFVRKSDWAWNRHGSKCENNSCVTTNDLAVCVNLMSFLNEERWTQLLFYISFLYAQHIWTAKSKISMPKWQQRDTKIMYLLYSDVNYYYMYIMVNSS